jgi:hypothetical protein
MNTYNAWEVKSQEFPQKGTIEEKITFFLRYGILAPSIHNTQPWRFQVSDGNLSIFPDTSVWLKYADETMSNLYISLGCCIMNIICAASYFGFSAVPIIENAHNKQKAYIKIIFKGSNKTDDEFSSLINEIPRRFSNKLHYKNIPFKPEIKQKLTSIGRKYKVDIALIDDSIKKDRLAELYYEAGLDFFQSKNFRHELSSWLRHNKTRKHDGMPGFVNGMSFPQSLLGPFIIKHLPPIPKVLMKKDKALLKQSPVIGLISSKENTVQDWINVGQAYEELTLTATHEKISTTVMAALIQNKKYTKKVSEMAKSTDNLHMFFRLGYTNTRSIHTPRKQLEVSLIT